MELSQKSWRRIVFFLSLVILLSPSTMEGEAWGPLDARSFRRSICNIIWSFETEGVQTMIDTTDTSWIQFPYLSISLYTIIGWIVGCLSLIVVLLYFSGRIRRYAAILILGLTTVLLVGAVGITVLSIEISYTVVPLPIPQIVGFAFILLSKERRFCI